MRVFQGLSGGKMPFPGTAVSGAELVPASTGVLPVLGFADPPSGPGSPAGAAGPLFGTGKVVGASTPTPHPVNRRDSEGTRNGCRRIERRPLLSMTWCVGVGIDVDVQRVWRSGRRAA